MKKLLTLTVISLLAACASPDATSSKFNAGLEKYNTNVEKVDAEFNYFENGDLQSMFDGASEDLIWSSPQGDSLTKNDGGVRSYGVWTYNHKDSGTEFETSYYSVQQFDEEGNTAFIWEFFDFGSIMLGLQ
jgi:ketosteroid isomerase-like protein